MTRRRHRPHNSTRRVLDSWHTRAQRPTSRPTEPLRMSEHKETDGWANSESLQPTNNRRAECGRAHRAVPRVLHARARRQPQRRQKWAV